MALNKDIVKNLEINSMAMYSTWVYYSPFRVLFDAGEGVCTKMRNFIFGINCVFLSHGHYDHIGGLGGMVYTRAAGRGDKEKPLTIYFPDGWDTIAAFKGFIGTVTGNIRYDLNWIPVEPGQVISISGEGRGGKYVRPFRVSHSNRALCLGFNVYETRKRLKQEFVHLSEEECAKMAREGRKAEIMEDYTQVLLAYSGDSSPVRPEDVMGAEVLVHDSTFVDPKDMEHDGHSSIEGAVIAARDAQVKALVLSHFSFRYQCQQALDEARKVVAARGFTGPVYVVWGDRMIPVNEVQA